MASDDLFGGSIPVVKWADFYKQWPHLFGQGEHVTLIGPTGCGKTLLSRELVSVRKYVVAVGVKHKDESMSELQSHGWKRIDKWSERPKNARRILLWPKESNVDRVDDVQRKAFHAMYRDVYKVGGWCVWNDELRVTTDLLKLKAPVVRLYIAGRSNNVSLVSAAQRPSHVPLEAYSQAQHLFLFRTGDERDLVRSGGITGVSSRQVAEAVAQLPFHSFLYVNLRDGYMTISQLER